MLKNKILLGSTIASVFFCSNLLPAHALELDEDTRTVSFTDRTGKLAQCLRH